MKDRRILGNALLILTAMIWGTAFVFQRTGMERIEAVRILIDNAAKYTQEGEEILLSYGKNEKGDPFLQVQDLGQGISESELPHLFER